MITIKRIIQEIMLMLFNKFQFLWQTCRPALLATGLLALASPWRLLSTTKTSRQKST